MHYIVTYCSLPTVLLLLSRNKKQASKNVPNAKNQEEKKSNSWRPSNICMYREVRVLIEPGVFKYNLIWNGMFDWSF